MSTDENFSIGGLVAGIIFAIIGWQFFIAWKELGTLEQLRNTGFILKALIDWIMPDNYKAISNFITVMLISYVIKTIICAKHAFHEVNPKSREYIQLLFLGEVITAAVLFGITPLGTFIFGVIFLGIPNWIAVALVKT